MSDLASISAVAGVVTIWAAGLWRLLWRVAHRLDGCEAELRRLSDTVRDLERTVWRRRPAWTDEGHESVRTEADGRGME